MWDSLCRAEARALREHNEKLSDRVEKMTQTITALKSEFLKLQQAPAVQAVRQAG